MTMKHIHFIGIGGTGLSAIARILLESGYTVSGSDQLPGVFTRELEQAGVVIMIGHSAVNVQGADVVIRSSAIPDDNPEVKAALVEGIPVLKRAEFLAQLMQGHICVAIAGTHGKTTTTAMVAWMLKSLGEDPSYIIGGISKDLGGNAHAGKGRIFVIEADEYDHMFLGLEPVIAVVTYMEHDHPDCFPTPADYRNAFADFVHRIKWGGCLLVCRDDPGAHSLIGEVTTGRKAKDYGINPLAQYRANILEATPGKGFTFEAYNGRQHCLARVSLQVPGEYNVRNALAALAVADALELDLEKAGKALEAFTGTGRRFDLRGEAGGVTIIDDYAHHPTEIRATLAAARSRYPNSRLWVVWQPHTYSRTRALLDEFAHSFNDADQVVVTEIYAAREHSNGFSAAQVVEKMPHPGAVFKPTLADASAYLLKSLQRNDVLLVLSAGDADQISTRVLEELTGRMRS